MQLHCIITRAIRAGQRGNACLLSSLLARALVARVGFGEVHEGVDVEGALLELLLLGQDLVLVAAQARLDLPRVARLVVIPAAQRALRERARDRQPRLALLPLGLIG